jgi:hypothetical protein
MIHTEKLVENGLHIGRNTASIGKFLLSLECCLKTNAKINPFKPKLI